ncbi:MAG TPA: excinuclease ABC subunit UvrC, partial [Negativicutes bacterium]|nr:excinuclease ABC subunit UvrC [Negativicutes bacterium]
MTGVEKTQLAAVLSHLPDKPGVYLMKDANAQVIYVGKAINLKNRVRSYFQESRNHTPKVRVMVEQIITLETIITGTEMEALILESNLIKKHRPKYNIRLRDDKQYPYLRIDVQDAFPRVTIARQIKKDGARYFGPYTSSGAVYETLRLLKKIFPLRTCKRNIGEDRGRPCLNYHIKRCLAPCDRQVDEAAYQQMIREICLFLEGRQDKLMKKLRAKMLDASDRMAFEQAAKIRDQIQAIEKVIEKQNINIPAADDQDALGLARNHAGTCVQVFLVRSGKLIGREHFLLAGEEGAADREVLTGFIKQYYARAAFIPKEILLPLEIDEPDLIAAWLTERRGTKVHLQIPKRGVKRELVNMATENAREVLDRQTAQLQQQEAHSLGAVAELQQYLQLTSPPYRIECFDNSNIQGADAVSSMVVFEGGKPKKEDYRRYKIKTVQGANDFATMQEVVHRRYKDGKPPLPDLIIIDGGKGQLHAARAVLHGLNLAHIPTYGLAKEFELLFREDDPAPIALPRHSTALFLVQRIRDEAHRFAITYHRQLRRKRNLASLLDEIPGVGAKRRKALYEHFGTIDKIKRAPAEDLAKVPGISPALAAEIVAQLN